MAKIGKREKVRILDQMRATLRVEAPLTSLQVTDSTTTEPQVYYVNYFAYLRWAKSNPEIKHPWRYAYHSPGGSLSDVDDWIVTALQEQLDNAVKNMEGFYRLATQHLAPQLVMEVLDGGNPSFKESFRKEISKVIATLSHSTIKAGKTLLMEGYKLECSCELHWWGGQKVGQLYMDNASGLTTSRNFPPIMAYVTLPQIVQHVNTFIAGLNAMTASLPTDPPGIAKGANNPSDRD